MDSALLREREAFKRRAMAQPVVENKKKEAAQASKAAARAAAAKEGGAQSHSAKAKLDLQKMKAVAGGSSQFRFGVLARIVRHMKTRHLEGEGHPLTLEDILDETKQLDVGTRTKNWLATEALKNNPKIDASPDGTYMFKPPYSLTSKKGLLKLLRQHDLKGQGGIFLEDIQESLPRCEKIIRFLTEENKIFTITRPVDKKKVIFYHDHTCDLEVDEDFQKLWRSVAVEGLDDSKIEEYLDRQGITSMRDQGPKKPAIPIRKRKGGPGGKRRKTAPKDNDHLKDVLEDYNEMTAEHRVVSGKKS